MKNETQMPATENQVETEQPKVKRSKAYPIIGKFSGSTNGGIARPVYYRRIMKNTIHQKTILDLFIQTLTPKTPVFHGLHGVIDVYWVPDTAVWEHADEFYAQRGGSTVQKITEMPNFGGKKLDFIGDTNNEEYTLITNTEQWRDCWISTYIPRLGDSHKYYGEKPTISTIAMPKYMALVTRGYPVIRNNYIRNKEYETEIVEYKTDTVSNEEWDSYMPHKMTYGVHTKKQYQIYSRNKKPDSYYTNYRTELQGYQIEKPDGTTNELLDWVQWENKIDMVRNSAEFAQDRDAVILAKLRGGIVADILHKAKHICRRNFDINYNAVTQTTYNNSPDVTDKEFNAMGKQGAYSYTKIQVPLYGAEPFLEEGTIHVFLSTYADTAFEKGINRQMLNITPFDIYRPDNAEKNDVMYQIETSTEDLDIMNNTNLEIKGFKRKFNELFAGNTVIFGDMTTTPWYTTEWDTYGNLMNDRIANGEAIRTNYTYQFNEQDERFLLNNDEVFYNDPQTYWLKKEVWLDYTDLQINKNLAFKRPIQVDNAAAQEGYAEVVKVSGNNQFSFSGTILFMEQAPIENAEEIANDFTKWGEH